jgi:hypothetical protein
MNRRIRKKHGALIGVQIVALPRTLNCANDSFWSLPLGTARYALHREIRTHYGDTPAVVWRAVRRHLSNRRPA